MTLNEVSRLWCAHKMSTKSCTIVTFCPHCVHQMGKGSRSSVATTTSFIALRIEELLATGADQIAVACPFCMTMIPDGVTGAGSSVPVHDIFEVVASRLAGVPAGS